MLTPIQSQHLQYTKLRSKWIVDVIFVCTLMRDGKFPQFPPYATNETGMVRFGRRELGHGNPTVFYYSPPYVWFL